MKRLGRNSMIFRVFAGGTVLCALLLGFCFVDSNTEKPATPVATLIPNYASSKRSNAVEGDITPNNRHGIERLISSNPERLIEEINSSDDQLRSKFIATIGETLVSLIKDSPRGFDFCENILLRLTPNEARALLRYWIFPAKSSSGVVVDYIRKEKLMDSLKIDDNDPSRADFLRSVGKSGAVEIFAEAHILRINEGDLRIIASTTLEDKGQRACCELIDALDDSEVKSKLIVEIIPEMLQRDSIRTSEWITSIEDINMRRAAVEEMVGWLDSRGDNSAARQWEDYAGRIAGNSD